MSWGRRLSTDELSTILSRGHVRLVRGAADLQAGERKKLCVKPQDRPLTRSQQQDKYSRRLAYQIREAGLPQPILEYPFCPDRKFRADLAWPTRSLLVEVKGGVHRIRGKFDRDIEREQIIFKLGYRLLQVTPQQVRDGTAVELVREALK